MPLLRSWRTPLALAGGAVALISATAFITVQIVAPDGSEIPAPVPAPQVATAPEIAPPPCKAPVYRGPRLGNVGNTQGKKY